MSFPLHDRKLYRTIATPPAKTKKNSWLPVAVADKDIGFRGLPQRWPSANTDS